MIKKMTKEDIIEFYNDNGVSLLNENGQLCELFFEQLTNDIYIYDYDSDSYEYIEQ